jgi:uncharacterized protein YbjT (DUF2867 family)
MKSAVFRAPGGTGRSFGTQALAAGHELRVLAHRPEALRPAPGLDVVAGDALDRALSVVGT